MPIDYPKLWTLVSRGIDDPHSIHGPSHWRRVEENGLYLSQLNGAHADIVRLFALFHDSCRWNDGHDPGHGARGAILAADMRSREHYELSDEEFSLLEEACIWHTDGERHDNITIATCWDADRLDLGRVGIQPDPPRMCTPQGRQIAYYGSIAAYERERKRQH
jgi:uncharacterized protein